LRQKFEAAKPFANMKLKLLSTAAVVGVALPLWAATLNESTFTEIIQDVQVVAGAAKTTTPAKVNELFRAPDLVRTGAGSRAELTAPDQSITRVGANTVFSFEPSGRNLRLDQGNVLFHSPKGRGGGTIKSRGVTAAILGTTLIVSAMTDGGVKVIFLEGNGRVTLPNGGTLRLREGQMVFIAPSGTEFSPVQDINLDRLVAGSLLVNGFSNRLPSEPLVQSAIARQKKMLTSGVVVDTGKSASSGLSTMDQGSYQTAAHPPLTPAQFAVVNPQNPAFIIGVNGIGGRAIVPR
jgi:hypothetical protein